MEIVPRDWDQHYAEPSRLDWTPAPLLVETVDALAPGRALDVACGAGRNALYLATLGWDVDAVDASPAAIRLLRQRAAGLRVHAHVADLERGEFPFPSAAYDLVCCFFYLQRDLFVPLQQAIRPGGTFLGAVFVRGAETESARKSAFELEPGELRTFFNGWKIPYYSESADPARPRRAARIVARRA
jgi:tellurite methyltransferase